MVDARVVRWPMRAWRVGRCARGVIIYIYFIVLLIKRNYHNFGLTKLNSKGSVLYCYLFRVPDVSHARAVDVLCSGRAEVDEKDRTSETAAYEASTRSYHGITDQAVG